MGVSANHEAALALHRFGLGPRLGSIAAIKADPRGALLAELDRSNAGVIAAGSLPTSAQAFRTVADANAERQAPGAQTILGKAYEDTGVEQARAVLRDLAVHPATARHVATKLARHFIADVPPPGLVETLTRTFLDTQGDLKQVSKALVASSEAWKSPCTKLKRPSEWVISMVRAAGTAADPARFTAGQMSLGEPLWRPPSPRGYGDDEAAWIDGIGQRLDVAHFYAERVAGGVDPQLVIDTVLESTVSDDTLRAVARAESRQQALALLFMSADFQRR